MSGWVLFWSGWTSGVVVPALVRWAIMAIRARRGCYCETVACFCRRVGGAAVLLALALAGCANPPPVKVPEKHTINTELSCYVVESERGGGLVCTEDPSACRALQKLTAVADGVTAISECRAANVIADAKE